jgi:hypothetical protein
MDRRVDDLGATMESVPAPRSNAQPARVCVIGAGPSGLAAAKNCVVEGLPVVVFEQHDQVGGNWVFNASTGHSSVYDNTHIISSKAWSQYEDFPMPADYPDYPSHRQMQAYFSAYAAHFGLLSVIRFHHRVLKVERQQTHRWQVTVENPHGETQVETFTHLMVCNGHHWSPKYPEYPGQFSGRYLHSHDFKGVTDQWRGKSVLVIGGGNSACDVAVESARLASCVSLSMRSAQWFIPKFIFGVPSDVFASRSRWLPSAIRNLLLTWLLRLLQGPYARYGLPQPAVPALNMHPTLNSDVLDYIRHGRISVRPAVARLDGDGVIFVDGKREIFDIICVCTGFWTEFPFFDKSFIDFKHVEKVPLFRKMLHEHYSDLYFIGLFQPLGCIWPLADHQARLACAEILGRYQRPANLRAAIEREMAHPHYPFLGGQRHAVEVDYHRFRSELKRELATAGVDIG